ncbi:MAG: Dabb family protein [Verrucomicrobia bacterium]|nr:Dabb family protein [Cytophagales bacterium]
MKKFSRIKFLEKITALLAVTSLTGLQTNAQPKSKQMFVHHVFFWLKNPGSKEEAAKLLQGLQSLAAIKSIKMIHIGVPANGKYDKEIADHTYTYSLLLGFDDATGEEKYINDPIHKRFVEENKAYFGKVMVYDSVNA